MEEAGARGGSHTLEHGAPGETIPPEFRDPYQSGLQATGGGASSILGAAGNSGRDGDAGTPGAGAHYEETFLATQHFPGAATLPPARQEIARQEFFQYNLDPETNLPETTVREFTNGLYRAKGVGSPFMLNQFNGASIVKLLKSPDVCTL